MKLCSLFSSKRLKWNGSKVTGSRQARHFSGRASQGLTCIHVFSPQHLDKEKKIHYHLLFSLLLQKMASVVRLWLCNTSALRNEMSIVPV
jgi:hypothetical protein